MICYPLSETLTAVKLPVFLDPVGMFETIRHLPYSVFLDSAPQGHDATVMGDSPEESPARFSFATAGPRMLFEARGMQVTIVTMDYEAEESSRQGWGSVSSHESVQGRILDIAQRFADELSGDNPATAHTYSAPADTLPHGIRYHLPEHLPPFWGGLLGYVGYEYGGVLEDVPPASEVSDLDIPDAVMGLYGWVLAWDHLKGSAWLIGIEKDVDNVLREIVHPNSHLTNFAVEQPKNMAQQMAIATREGPATNVATAKSFEEVSSSLDAAQYMSAVSSIIEYIRAGDIFQANLTQRFTSSFPKHLLRSGDHHWKLYKYLRKSNPAPYGCFMKLPDFSIVSASPERFLHLSRDGKIDTRPIKGTRPRGATQEEDDLNSDQLRLSAKDIAEHVMIVDVLRNDISRVSEYGSVRVPSLLNLEKHPTVHHLVSTVTGSLRKGLTAVDLLHACFPGGSITGAPKVRAMEIIAELEPVNRNVYCGAIGYISFSGAMDTSIAIRTVTIRNGTAYFSAGGGIVADSDPEAEYQESLDKAKALIQALNRFNNPE